MAMPGMTPLRLHVMIVEARHLRAADWTGSSDPYCELRVKNQTQHFKTKTLMHTKNPMWNESFTLTAPRPATDFLSIKIYDYDTLSNNDLIGELEIPVSSFVGRPPMDEWRQLAKRHGHGWATTKGELRVIVSLDGATMPGVVGVAPVIGMAPVAVAPVAVAPVAVAPAYPPMGQPSYPPAYPQQQPYAPQAHAPPPYPQSAPGGYPGAYPQQSHSAVPPVGVIGGAAIGGAIGAYGASHGAYPPQQQYPPAHGAYPPVQQQYPPVQSYPPAYGGAHQAYPSPYGAPMGHAPMGHAPSFHSAPMMGAPMMASHGYGAPAMGGYGKLALPHGAQFVSVPQMYAATTFQYPGAYYPGQAFLLPINLPPHLQAKMMQASAMFRRFDTNFSGHLSKKEWKRAMWSMGYYMSKHDAKRLFYMIDKDHSGKISEREFAEYWLSTNY